MSKRSKLEQARDQVDWRRLIHYIREARIMMDVDPRFTDMYLRFAEQSIVDQAMITADQMQENLKQRDSEIISRISKTESFSQLIGKLVYEDIEIMAEPFRLRQYLLQIYDWNEIPCDPWHKRFAADRVVEEICSYSLEKINEEERRLR